MRAALNASDSVAVEADLTDPDVRQRMAKSLSAPDNNLPLPDPLLERIQAFAERACFPLSALDKTPLRQKLPTLVRYMLQYDGFYPEYGVDLFLSQFARFYGAHASHVPESQALPYRLQSCRAGSKVGIGSSHFRHQSLSSV